MDKANNSKTIYKVLLSIIAALTVIIAIGTIIGLVRQKDAPLVSFGKADETITLQAPSAQDDIRIFSGLGRLRIPLANSGVLILSIAFPYPASDIAFTEELAGKIPEFKTIASHYFSNLPENEIALINEEKAKAEILSSFNGVLKLGQISTLYFSDMLIIGVD